MPLNILYDSKIIIRIQSTHQEKNSTLHNFNNQCWDYFSGTQSKWSRGKQECANILGAKWTDCERVWMSCAGVLLCAVNDFFVFSWEWHGQISISERLASTM